MVERTLSIIKPDAIERKLEGAIISKLENSGFTIVAQKKILLSKSQAQLFYREHSAKPFFDELTTYMSSIPVVVQILEKENCVVEYRTIMGATDPKMADEGTIRREFGVNISQNSIHGSDNIESSWREIHFFFSDVEINK
ncbi:MAG: nucleoside-diphosphate kinase [Rickettsiales bacterium]|jgi:nucleoside-diphosphate kinase|nr:nucleoside-diphosphate kinase [Rickettsiales bacterium]